MRRTRATPSPENSDARAVLPAGRRAVKNTIYLVIGDAATKIALFVLYAVIARVLGTRGFGDYTVAISLAFFVTSAALGIDVIVSREIARDPDNVHGLFWESIWLKLLAGIPILGLVVLVAVLSHDRTSIVLSVTLLGLSNLIDVVAQTPHSVLRGVEDMAPTSRALVVEGLVEVVLAVLVLTLLSSTLVALGVVALIASVVALVYVWVALDRRGFRPRRHGTTRGSGWLMRAAIPTGITSIFGYLLGRLDAVLLSLITHNPQIVGYYGAAYRIFEGTLFLSWAVGLAVYPILSRLPKHSPDLRRMFENSSTVAAAISMPLGAAMCLFGPVIVSDVFGHNFAGGGTASRWLGACTAIYGPYVIAAMTMAAQDRQQAFPLIAGIALALNIVLNLILIPAIGVDGAAIAMDAAQVLLTVIMMVLLVEITGPYSLTRIYGSSLAGIASMALVALLIGDTMVGLLVALILFYAAFLTTEAGLHRQDVQEFVVALRSRAPAQGPGTAAAGAEAVVEAGSSPTAPPTGW